jgi:peptidoglycan/xylan/chitin deacetylase (PgdA/CDA1 family)
MQANYLVSAHPNPINISKYASSGKTTISWIVVENRNVEIHIDAPDGPLFCRSDTSGSKLTGDWVEDGMIFYLQDVSDDKPLNSENTLASITIKLKKKSEWLKNPFNWVKRKIETRGLILMYHRISEKKPDPWQLNVSPEHFAEHLQILKKIVSKVRLYDAALALKKKDRLPNPWVAITLDDGYADNLKNAKSILEQNDYPATIFLTTSAIENGAEFWWDELERILLHSRELPEQLLLKISEKNYQWELGKWARYEQADIYQHLNWHADEKVYPTSRHSLYVQLHGLLNPLPEFQRKEILERLNIWAGHKYDCQPIFYPLTKNEVLQLSQCKLIEIGSHTLTHVNLSRVPVNIQREEILGSKKFIENLIGRSIFSLSYPHGAYGSETMTIVQNAGYSCACSNTRGIITHSTNRFLLPRIHVVDSDGDLFERDLCFWLKR